jgi:hypothetical protein
MRALRPGRVVGHARAARFGVVAFAWIALVLASSGCQLLLDFSELSDGGPSDDGSVPADASALCAANEPNDAFDMATAVTSGALGAVCGGGDRDFYGFTVDGAQDLEVVVTFTAGEETDLELNLVDATGAVLTVSTGLDADERIEQSLALGNRLAAGDYAAEIFGRTESVSNEYELILTITTP